MAPTVARSRSRSPPPAMLRRFSDDYVEDMDEQELSMERRRRRVKPVAPKPVAPAAPKPVAPAVDADELAKLVMQLVPRNMDVRASARRIMDTVSEYSLVFSTWDKPVGFGKHALLRYGDIYADQGYCAWVQKLVADSSDVGENVCALAAWLGLVQAAPRDVRIAMLAPADFAAGGYEASEAALRRLADIRTRSVATEEKVGFGKHADMTRNELLAAHPGYCAWVRKTADATSKLSMAAFATWLADHDEEEAELKAQAKARPQTQDEPLDGAQPAGPW